MTAASSAAPPPVPVAIIATAVGGAAGAVLRWWLTVAFPSSAGQFPRTIFAINVVGSGLLAALPLVPAVRRRPWLVLLLGTGVLGGFTTMSAASAETFELLDGGHVATGLAYALGTMLAALAVVLLVDRFSTPERRHDVENEGADR